MSEPRIAWDAQGVPPPRPFVEVVGPRWGADLVGLVVTPVMVSLFTHFVPKIEDAWKSQIEPHIDPPTQCRGCRLARPKRWKGYVGCYGFSRKTYWIAEITADAARSCPQLSDRSKSLRGLQLTLHRMHRAANAPVLATLATPRQGTILPGPIDVPAALMRLWGFEAAQDAEAQRLFGIDPSSSTDTESTGKGGVQ
jgi:hypothetical protein